MSEHPISASELAARLDNAIESLLAEVALLPAELLAWKPAADVWSVTEILCHVAEFVPYWTSQALQIIRQPDQAWGRTHADEARLEAVRHAGSQSVADVFSAIRGGAQQSVAAIRELRNTDFAIEAPSRNPRWGSKPASFVIVDLLIDHVVKHLGQIRRNVKQAGAVISVDAVIVGAGFGGLYGLKKLRDELGLTVVVFDKAEGVGGTWYWNRYPGAQSDSEAYLYCYSWDEELLQEWELEKRFSTQPEVLKYLERVVQRHNLLPNIQLGTGVTEAHFDEATNSWLVSTEDGRRYRAKYLVTALGLLAATNMPDIQGRENFTGDIYHTSRWPKDATIKGKRVGVIGTGSSGVQTITRHCAGCGAPDCVSAICPIHGAVRESSAQRGRGPADKRELQKSLGRRQKFAASVWLRTQPDSHNECDGGRARADIQPRLGRGRWVPVHV